MFPRLHKIFRDGELIKSTFIEVSWSEIRSLRNNQLNRTDLYLITDYPITDEQRDEIREYRTALRDLPANHTTSNEAADAFPEQPEWMVD